MIASSVHRFAVHYALLLWLLTACSAPVAAQSWAIDCATPGQVLTSPDGNVTLTCGNSPNVVTVPHNGTFAPATMTPRTAASCPDGSYYAGNDKGAWLLATYIATPFTASSGKHLWIVRNRVDRAYLDPNRPVPCATGGDPEAQVTYDYFHQAIQYAHAHIAGRGFHWDLHTNGSHDRRIELGFVLPRDKFFAPEPFAEETSLRAFAATHEGAFTDLLRDLGTRLRDAGYAAIPSQSQWEPEPGDDFYEGGHLLNLYGCPTTADLICGVQVEIHKGIYTLSTTQQKAFGAAFAQIMRDYLAQFGITW